MPRYCAQLIWNESDYNNIHLQQAASVRDLGGGGEVALVLLFSPAPPFSLSVVSGMAASAHRDVGRDNSTIGLLTTERCHAVSHWLEHQHSGRQYCYNTFSPEKAILRTHYWCWNVPRSHCTLGVFFLKNTFWAPGSQASTESLTLLEIVQYTCHYILPHSLLECFFFPLCCIPITINNASSFHFSLRHHTHERNELNSSVMPTQKNATEPSSDCCSPMPSLCLL